MSAAAVFDTHAYIKRFTAAGIPEAQAEVQVAVIAEVLESQLASKRDIQELRAAAERDAAATQRQIQELRAATERDVAATQQQIQELRAATERDIAATLRQF
jgi:hypothetical protein